MTKVASTEIETDGGPWLGVTEASGSPIAVALLLHGGQERSDAPVPPWRAAALRMHPFAGAIRRRIDGVAVARLRYRHRGWNDPDEDPIADVHFAVDELSTRFDSTPVITVGHSMGGRAALRTAGHPSVRGVVLLAPWLPGTEPVPQLAGRELVVMHGTRDRTTDPARSVALCERARSVADSVVMALLERTDHPMLRRAPLWHALTAGAVADIATGIHPAAALADRATRVTPDGTLRI